MQRKAHLIPALASLTALVGTCGAAPTIVSGPEATLEADGIAPVTVRFQTFTETPTGAGSYLAQRFIEVVLPGVAAQDSPVEITTGPQATTGGYSDDYLIGYYDEMGEGTSVGPAMDAVWHGSQVYNFGWGHLIEPIALIETAHFSYSCFTNFILSSAGWPGFDSNDSDGFSIPVGAHYFGFRWVGDDNQTRYGWVEFDFQRGTASKLNGDGCDYSNPSNFPNTTEVSILAIAWESEPDTAIVAGGGLCPADLNFDASVDFFDVSAFLDAFGDADDLADINGDGSFDFFDVSEFLTQYNDSCGL